jgi:hypothetical protein
MTMGHGASSREGSTAVECLLRLSMALACIAALAIMVGCGSGGEDSNTGSDGRNAAAGKIEIVKWGVGSVLGPESVEIASTSGYCLGDRRPHYGVVKVKEVGRRAYITARAVIPPEEGPKGSSCEGVGTTISKAISFRRNLIAMELYDGVSKPPSLRWSPLQLPARKKTHAKQ